MITIYNAQTKAELGTLSEAQFQELSNRFEEEWPDDHDYYINEETVEMLQADGVSSVVIEILQRAIAETGEADIQWGQS